MRVPHPIAHFAIGWDTTHLESLGLCSSLSIPHPTAYGYLILRSPNTFTNIAPATNPPTCAQNATPPIVGLCTASSVAVPLKKFNTNQYPKIIHAET